MANIKLKQLLETAVERKPLKEINFGSQNAFDDYIKQHELRPDTKVTIRGKAMTVAQARKNSSEPAVNTKPNDMFGGDYAKDRGDSGFGWGPETDRTPATSLPKKASQLNDKHSNTVANTVNKEAGLDGYAQTDDNTGAIMFNASKGDMPTYTLYVGANDDYGKPDEFRVSLEPTYGNDPSNIGEVDKSFKSAEEAMAFAVEVAKKYKKELEMDDEAPNDEPKVRPQSKVQDFVKNLSGKKYKEFAFDNDIDHRDPMEMQDFIESLSDEEAEEILKKYGTNESTKLMSMIKK